MHAGFSPTNLVKDSVRNGASLKLVLVENFEISTFRLSGGCSAFELHQVWKLTNSWPVAHYFIRYSRLQSGNWKVICGSGRYIVHCVPNRLIASKDPIYINCIEIHFWIVRFMLTTMHKRLSCRIPLNDRKSGRTCGSRIHRFFVPNEASHPETNVRIKWLPRLVTIQRHPS